MVFKSTVRNDNSIINLENQDKQQITSLIIQMDFTTKSPITFSITGILSTGKTSKDHERDVKPSRQTHYRDTERHSPSDLRIPVLKRGGEHFEEDEEGESYLEHDAKRYNEYYSRQLSPQENYSRHLSELSYLHYKQNSSTCQDVILEDYRPRAADSPSPPKIFRSTSNHDVTRRLSTSPTRREDYSAINPSTLTNQNKLLMSPSFQNGRFRPPPFFDTVLTLRKRLYCLGGKVFAVDEPPSDRNVHKVWRSMEKHKVNYSLQHYFYVASLSNRCFDLVERIHQKVSRGLLEGSRDKEMNQSYFNFLYGKTEEERYELLRLLEKGEISPKAVSKSKHSTASNKNIKTDETCSTKCHNCKEQIQKVVNEKEMIERKFETLKRKYNKMMSETSAFYDKDGRGCIKSKSV